ncbi:MAG: hypothetical protein HY721_32830 [Planctomycetes bacterium]|nr:hypothetical protein [Planctomycetota bacterium]
MRRNLVTGIILLCGLAGALDLGYHLGRQGGLPTAEGQAAEFDVLIAAANTQSEAFCFVFNRKSNQLVSYMQRSSGGLELKGIRTCRDDFPAINEYPKSQSQTAVRNMKKIAEQLEKDKDKEK